ncbi:MAG TPA: hypothetical protein V6D20_05305, partial [Candidatus Obscuribacterales bacterium]
NFQIGARISAIPELRPSPGKTDRSSWLHNRPRKCVELLCQTDQLRKLKPILNDMYSPKTTTIFTRPGFRYTIFIPEMALLLGGPKLAQRRQAMLANHERFTTHLKYIDQDATAMIEELDLPYTLPGGSAPITLREFLMTIPYPYPPQGDQSPSPLAQDRTKDLKRRMFHSVDQMTRNGQLQVVITAFHERVPDAMSILGALPAMIAHYISKDAMKAWIYQAYHHQAHEITIQADGTWETTDDTHMEETQQEMETNDMPAQMTFDLTVVKQTEALSNTNDDSDSSKKRKHAEVDSAATDASSDQSQKTGNHPDDLSLKTFSDGLYLPGQQPTRPVQPQTSSNTSSAQLTSAARGEGLAPSIGSDAGTSPAGAGNAG